MDDDIFDCTLLANPQIPPSDSPRELSILDVDVKTISTPPHFTEQATLQAMVNLGILPEDLVIKEASETITDTAMRLKISIELEKKRLTNFEKIVAERLRILNKPPAEPKKARSIPVHRKKKKRTKSKPKAVPKEPKEPKLPPLQVTGIPKRKAKKSVRPIKTNRRRVVPSPIPKTRANEALHVKQQLEAEQIAKAQSALERVQEVEKRAKELRRQKQERFRKRLEDRETRLRKDHQTQLETEKKRQERAIMHNQDRAQKKYMQEAKWRQEKVYGVQKSTQKNSRLSELRKKMIAQGQISSPPPKPMQQPKTENKRKIIQQGQSKIPTFSQMTPTPNRYPKANPKVPISQHTLNNGKKSMIPILRS